MNPLDIRLSHPWPWPIRRRIMRGMRALRNGQADRAAGAFAAALALEPNLPEAHLGLAIATRPGPDYLAWMAELHRRLQPSLYVEIGVEAGHSLRLARPPTRALGIDPAPTCDGVAWQTTTEVIACTSAEFLTDPATPARLNGPISLALVDGDHRFAAVLRDIAGLEAHMAPDGVIAVHDTWPVDALTAEPERRTGFYTGDGWKAVLCLRTLRPDLSIITLRTAPTGLTLITGFDPASTLIHQRFGAILAAWQPLPHAALARDEARLLALRDNSAASLDQFLRGRPTTTAKSSPGVI